MNLGSIFKYFKNFKNHLTRRNIIILAVVIAAAVGIFIYNQKTRQKPIEYTLVKRQDITSTVSTSGVLSGKEKADLHFKASGKLAYLNSKVGETVATGSAVAGLDTAQLAISLKQAQNTLADKQAALEKVLDDIHLFQYGNGGFGNVGTPNETETQRAARISAEQAANNAYDSVKAAQTSFSDVAIFSPISGLVTKADPVTGAVVSPTDLIAEIVDTSEVFFDAEVDESDISKVQLGQKAKVTLNAYPGKNFTGGVAQIKPTTKTASSGATVVIVRIKLDQVVNFISDLNGQAEIQTEKANNVLTIPQDALTDDKFVYIQDGKKFKKQEVKTGISSDLDIEVKEGLSEGEKIVKNPSNVPNK